MGWYILLRNPLIYCYCAILITAVAIHWEPFSRCQGLVQSSKSIASNNLKRNKASMNLHLCVLAGLGCLFLSAQTLKCNVWSCINFQSSCIIIPKSAEKGVNELLQCSLSKIRYIENWKWLDLIIQAHLCHRSMWCALKRGGSAGQRMWKGFVITVVMWCVI